MANWWNSARHWGGERHSRKRTKACKCLMQALMIAGGWTWTNNQDDDTDNYHDHATNINDHHDHTDNTDNHYIHDNGTDNHLIHDSNIDNHHIHDGDINNRGNHDDNADNVSQVTTLCPGATTTSNTVPPSPYSLTHLPSNAWSVSGGVNVGGDHRGTRSTTRNGLKLLVDGVDYS